MVQGFVTRSYTLSCMLGGLTWASALGLGAPAAANAQTNWFENEIASFYAYETSFQGGVTMALTDDSRRTKLFTAPGPGGSPRVRGFDGPPSAPFGVGSENFFAYSSTFPGGVNIAVGDITRRGVQEIITGAETTAPHVRVIRRDNNAELRSFYAFDPSIGTGVRVASCDVNKDGYDDIVAVPAKGAELRIRVFSGKDNSLLRDISSFIFTNLDVPLTTKGNYIACGDIDGNGFPDFVIGDGEGVEEPITPLTVAVLFNDGPNLPFTKVRYFIPFASSVAGTIFRGFGVRVATVDIDGDGIDEIVVGLVPGGKQYAQNGFQGGSPLFVAPSVRIIRINNLISLKKINPPLPVNSLRNARLDNFNSGAVFHLACEFFPYGSNYRGSVHVAGNETGMIATAPGESGGSPHVRVFNVPSSCQGSSVTPAIFR